MVRRCSCHVPLKSEVYIIQSQQSEQKVSRIDTEAMKSTGNDGLSVQRLLGLDCSCMWQGRHTSMTDLGRAYLLTALP